MRKALALLVILALCSVGIYAWGIGAFRPCEPAGRLFAPGTCTQVFDLPGGRIGDLVKLSNGNILLATDAPENAGGALIELSPDGGAPVSRTTLPVNAVGTSVTAMAVSDDETRVALSLSFGEGDRRYGTQVFDRSGALVADIARDMPGYLDFDAQDRLLMHPATIAQGLPKTEDAEAFSLTAPDRAAKPLPAETLGLFARGLNAVLGLDGRTFAMLMDHPTDEPMVGLRIGMVGREAEPGMLLAADLRAGCSYGVSRMAFSGNDRVAAEFNCPEQWGQTSSALLVWDLIEGKRLLTLPSVGGFGNLLWLDDNTIVAPRYDQSTGDSELFRIAIPDLP